MCFIDAIETIKKFVESFEQRAKLIIFVFLLDDAEVGSVEPFDVFFEFFFRDELAHEPSEAEYDDLALKDSERKSKTLVSLVAIQSLEICSKISQVTLLMDSRLSWTLFSWK